MSLSIDYYLAPQSPWTYLGHARLVQMAAKHGAQVRLKPVDLGKVFPVSGGLPLAQRAPQRQAYRLLELARWRDALGAIAAGVFGGPSYIIDCEIFWGQDRLKLVERRLKAG